MQLNLLFSPKSVAVIGASSTIGSVGNDLVKNLSTSFKGHVYPVNPKGGELYNLPVFTSIKSISNTIDLAVIAVPAAIVSQVLKEVGQKKIPVAVVISAGFKEAGDARAETELLAIAQKYNITLIGPNCLGVINPHIDLNASFAPTMPPAGTIAFLSQSGALGTAILDYAQEHSIGFSKFVSMGNKAQIDETDMLKFLASDPTTKVIIMYVEQMTELDQILKVALQIRRHRPPKPIIILKSGQTTQGMKAASSHTGALAGNDAFYDALFREAGIIRASSIEELFAYAECFATNPLLKKDRVAVVTNAGGLGVLVTDALVAEELKLAELSSATIQKLAKVLPSAAGLHNPVDILGDAPALRYQQALKIVTADENVDTVVVLLTPQSMTEVEATARTIVELKKATKKPIVVSFLGGTKVAKGVDILEQNHVTSVSFPEWAAKSLGVLHSFTKWRGYNNKPASFKDFDRSKIKQLFHGKRAVFSEEGWMDGELVLELLEACNLPVVKRTTITTASQAKDATTTVGGLAVFKILSPEIQHKSDVGGVMLGVTPETAATAFDTIIKSVHQHLPKATISGVQVTQQIPLGKRQELLIGAIRDPRIGTLIGCGAGGVYTEVLHDASFTLAPASHQELLDTVHRLKLYPILAGARNQPAFAIEALIDCMARVAHLIELEPSITELDINPLFLFEKGSTSKNDSAVIVDARLRRG